MREVTAIAVVILAASATAALCPWLIGFLQRRSMVDVENGRTSHRGAVPRGGGLAVLFGGAVSLAVHWNDWTGIAQLRAVAVFAVAFGLLGLADDVRTLPAGFRLGMQAILAVGFMVVTELEPIATMGIVGAAIAAFWIMAFVNAFNFMDGINGISVATTAIIGTSLAVASYRWDGGIEIPALAVVGAAIGFAPFNAMSARIFLGDVGSYLLGSGLALLAVVAVANGVPALVIGLPFLVYGADVAVTFLRRAHRRERIFKSHREHVYQQITGANGLTHQQTTLVVSGFTLMLVLLAQAAASGTVAVQTAAVLFAAGLVIVYLALPSFARARAE